MEENHGAAQKRRRYTVAEKLQIMEDARARTVAAASISSGASRSSIHEWMRQESIIAQYHPSMKRCSRGVVEHGTPPISPHQEHERTPPISPHQEHERSEVSASQSSGPSKTTCNYDRRSSSPITQPDTNVVRSEQGGSNRLAIASRASRRQSNNVRASHLSVGTDTAGPSPSPARSSRVSTRCARPKPPSKSTRRAFDTILVGINGGNEGFTANATRKTFDHLTAVGSLCLPTYNLLSYAHVVQTMRALHQGELDFAVVPTETLWSAAFQALLDKLVSFRLVIVGEIVSAEPTCASALPGTQIEDIDCVISDWRILEKHDDYILQLEELFHRTLVRQVTCGTSLACRTVREEQATNTLVLCREEAAKSNGLSILQERVSSSHARTKYTVLARHGAAALRFERPGDRGHAPVHWQQSAYMLYTTQEAVLAELVNVFARHDAHFERLHVYNKGDDPTRIDQAIAISYRSNVDTSVETDLRRELIAVADRVVHLGNYPIHDLETTK